MREMGGVSMVAGIARLYVLYRIEIRIVYPHAVRRYTKA
jgi:hypothetical protein